MKTIKFPAGKADFFKDILKNTVGSAPERGYSIDDVRLAIKAIDKIDAATNEIELEDAEYGFVASRVKQAQWKIASPDIIEFVDCVSGA